MANVYLNTGTLSLYQSSNGTSWTAMSGSSPYTLAVGKYYKLTATAPASGQIFNGWKLSNNVDNIIQLADNFNLEAIFNTLNQTWDYNYNITITITPTYDTEDTDFLNKRGLKDVINRVTKIQNVTEFPTVSNAKENTLYIKCTNFPQEAVDERFSDLSDLGDVFGIEDSSTLNEIRDLEGLIVALSSFRDGTVDGNTAAAALETKYSITIPSFHFHVME